ncbi:hypothetical protein FLA105534_04613 [Flavobacterium bizetiae]|uniref:Uncharacterized protein n=1 Tax=Flavobacterium bizetiae TaxID=2704140 RepID=A0A6J4GWY4_9FLAO|nr:hypothetical protein [Flavobacterium bizetiae]CAA9203407.1 hypothetical protein FLA105534_04613 [Flavobacterium bizetiae]CAD5340796.1 hypothetical protein FLA105535_00752 [Flavobacterium bizetiae]CAD5349868.1 hypothetical protein FLA105534_03855 [Flavobacterium bizetiae]
MSLRKITVEDKVYLYKSVTGFGSSTAIATFEITIFLEHYKLTPLKINFITWEDAYAGNPLSTGIKLTRLSTREEEVVNFNRPKYIREFVLYGLKMGWNGQNKVDSIDGLKILTSLDYDVSSLHPKEGVIIAHGKEYLK